MDQSSERSQADQQRYRELLLAHLAGRELKEILFFVNPRRFELLRKSIGDLLQRSETRVLNVAGGPFALEFYLAGRQADITSIDIDPALPDLHAALLAEGLIAGSTHHTSDVLTYEPQGSYDLIIINDLLYSRAVDFTAILEKYRHHLSPGGVLYFDILDQRASAVWRAFNKDARFRRYSIDAVRGQLQGAGFRIESEQPSFGIKGGLDALARRLLFRIFGIANNVVFKARRKAATGIVAAFVSLLLGIDYLAVELG